MSYGSSKGDIISKPYSANGSVVQRQISVAEDDSTGQQAQSTYKPGKGGPWTVTVTEVILVGLHVFLCCQYIESGSWSQYLRGMNATVNESLGIGRILGSGLFHHYMALPSIGLGDYH